MQKTILRDLSENDLDTIVRWRNDPVVSKCLSDRLKTKNETETWYNRLKGNPRVWLKAITYDNRLIGYAVIESIDETNRKCELVIIIGESDYWGKGIGLFVLQKMLEHAFVALQMHRVWAVTSRYNERSEKLLKKAGFTHEGILREPIIIDGKFMDLLMYSILENEYH
jgi:RimJ/RimL family protein N-acetyltransferase